MGVFLYVGLLGRSELADDEHEQGGQHEDHRQEMQEMNVIGQAERLPEQALDLVPEGEDQEIEQDGTDD